MTGTLRTSRTSREPRGRYKEVLVLVAGMTPQVVTEAIWALREQMGVPVSEVWVFTTGPGREIIDKALLFPQTGQFHAYCREYGIPPGAIQFDAGTVFTVTDSKRKPLPDIRTAEDYQRMEEAVSGQLRRFADRGGTRLHCCIAGGRKGMGVVVAQALSLYARPQDRLYHLLVSPEFENEREFFYPPRKPRIISVYKRGGDIAYLNTRDARIEMAPIPFVKLRSRLPERLRSRLSFTDEVAAVQESLPPPRSEELLIDTAGGTVAYAGRHDRLPSGLLAYYAFFAQARSKGWGEQGDGFLTLEEIAQPRMQVRFREIARWTGVRREESPAHARGEDAAILKSRWESARSKINKALGKTSPHAIMSERRGDTRYGLRIAPERVRLRRGESRTGLPAGQAGAPSSPPRTFLLNAPVITDYGDWQFQGPLRMQEARDLLQGGFVSAIGHQGTAEFLGSLLGLEVPTNRISVTLRPGDRAVVVRLRERIPEGKTLTAREMRGIPCELGLLTRRR